MEKTTITISHECWKVINERREPGLTMEDVIMKAMNEVAPIKKGAKKK